MKTQQELNMPPKKKKEEEEEEEEERIFIAINDETE